MGRVANAKNRKIRNTLDRHKDEFDEKEGVSIINDFMQLSGLLEEMKEKDHRAFNALYALIQMNMDLEEIVRERGERISKLQKGRTQPK